MEAFGAVHARLLVTGRHVVPTDNKAMERNIRNQFYIWRARKQRNGDDSVDGIKLLTGQRCLIFVLKERAGVNGVLRASLERKKNERNI